VIFRAEFPDATTETPEEVVKLAAAVLGNAHNGAGKMATGPATRAVRINFLREKLDLTVFFMGETIVLFDQDTPIQGRAKCLRR